MVHTDPVAPTTTAPTAKPSLVRAGGLAFMISAFAGRLPSSTIQLGLLMVVTGSGLGFTLGGLTVAAVGIGSAIGAPIIGGLVDRFGPLPVVASALAVQSLGLLAVLALITTGALPATTILVCAAVIGMANPQVGPIARARWSMLARQHKSPDLIRNAMGYEGAMDETSFVLGPALAGLLVGLLGPVPALWWLLALAWLGEGAFLAYLWLHRQQWRHTTLNATDPTTPARLPLGTIVWPLLACLCVGTLFGSTQTALTAINEVRGTPQFTGLVYGSVGIGSAVVSLLVVRLRRLSLGTRIAIGGAFAAATVAWLSTLVTPLPSSLVAMLVGAAVGAVLVSAITLVERAAPAGVINQAMTLASTCLTLGVSLGAAVAGQLVDVPGRGFVPAITAGAVAMVAGLLTLRRGRY